MDTIERLARALALAHPTLDDVIHTDVAVWRRVIAVAMSDAGGRGAAYRELLRTVRDDLSKRASALIESAHSGVRHGDGSADGASSPAVIAGTDETHPRPALECWSPEEFTDRESVSHACTVPPGAGDCAVAS